MTARMGMVKNSPQWHSITRLIGQEKDFIKHLRDDTANISQHPQWKVASV